ncbi:MAG: DNA polymerase III subunit delta' [Methylococcales bacterium]|nr:DNA polymerase III subunit delta' [Methylococcales bacterium]
MTEIQQSFPWLQTSWTQLNHYIKHKRIPQALLITGNKGFAQQQLAENFTQSILCMNPMVNGCFCGTCQSCKLFIANTHPDFTLIEPEEPGKAIGISIIRQLITKLLLKPQFEKYRVVIINPADSMNNASANAFLKYLEEPTERTCLILISNKPSKLPVTITSRCQKLIVSTPDKSLVNKWLQQQGLLKNTEFLLNLAQGSPLLAVKFSDRYLLELRAKCFDQWIKLTSPEENLVTLAEQWSKLEREKIDLLMFWLISWVSDMIKLSYQNTQLKIVNSDLITDLQDLVQRLDLKELYKYYDFLLLSQQRLDTPINKQLMIEEVLIRRLKLN